MNYAVFYEEKMVIDDGFGGTYTKKVPSYVEFADEAALLYWINFKPKDIGSYKVIEYNEIKVRVKLEIERPQKTRFKPEDFDDRFRKALEVSGSATEPVSTRLVN